MCLVVFSMCVPWHFTGEVGGLIATSHAAPPGHSRVRTQWSRLGAPRYGFRCRDAFRRNTLFHPVDDCLERALRLWTRPTGTMPDTWRQEQPRELLRTGQATALLHYAVVVVNRPHRIDKLIRPAVPDNQLAAAFPESAKVWIVGGHHRTDLLHVVPEVLQEVVRIDGIPVPVRIEIHQ